MHPLFSDVLAHLGIAEKTPPSPEAWPALLERISLAYSEADEARGVLERALEVASREMQHLHERHRASSEYLIALERDKLAAVLRSVAAGVLTLDYADRVAGANPESERLLGFVESEMLGRNVCELLGVSSLDASESSNQCDADFTCKNGSLLPVSYALTPIHQGHAGVGGVLVFFDLTERQKVERLKSDFVSIVSHELRTPLTAIRGALGLLTGGVLGDLSSDARSCIAIAHQNAERLVRLVNDILDMQKIEAGKLDFDLAVCDLAELVARSVADNRSFADQYGVRLTLEPRLDRALVRVDRDRILQVLANLISNAAKFSPPGGEVTIGLIPQGGAYCIEVSDEGCGIPEEFRDRIFGKFAQADASTSRLRGGTGLGLSISKSIVEWHGGSIGFHARKEGGTTFYFAIPTLDATSSRRPYL